MAIGNIPVGQHQLIDGDFVNGITQGHNMVSQTGISAAGTNHATSTQLADRIAFLEIDTSSASQGVSLPAAISGVQIFVGNNTSNNVTVFPSIANNPVTGTQDTFNAAATSFPLNANTGQGFTCIKTGIWFTN